MTHDLATLEQMLKESIEHKATFITKILELIDAVVFETELQVSLQRQIEQHHAVDLGKCPYKSRLCVECKEEQCVLSCV